MALVLEPLVLWLYVTVLELVRFFQVTEFPITLAVWPVEHIVEVAFKVFDTND